MLAGLVIPGDTPPPPPSTNVRTICGDRARARRLQRPVSPVQPAMLAYFNRLSDLLWLFGRKLERDAGVRTSLREAHGKSGTVSRAW